MVYKQGVTSVGVSGESSNMIFLGEFGAEILANENMKYDRHEILLQHKSIDISILSRLKGLSPATFSTSTLSNQSFDLPTHLLSHFLRPSNPT